eukprot:CAMPEP_0170564962 /NCGR_PEP_ID=MMETSP0211-20121228/75928_1 /TAXON_ID=311385 /ORGANISM="Pseudokeronopsis sp., Strain OXSARD2" /LENGTH=48 /DNA_ID= /DNA_START= /DNA_END= /DNA_ORIENTATION=
MSFNLVELYDLFAVLEGSKSVLLRNVIHKSVVMNNIRGYFRDLVIKDV